MSKAMGADTTQNKDSDRMITYAQYVDILKSAFSQLMLSVDRTESFTRHTLLSGMSIPFLDQFLRAFDPPPPALKRGRIAETISWLSKRQWLMIVMFGTIVVPTAFYVSSITERVPLIQYMRYATLSWLSFLSAAVLRLRR